MNRIAAFKFWWILQISWLCIGIQSMKGLCCSMEIIKDLGKFSKDTVVLKPLCTICNKEDELLADWTAFNGMPYFKDQH